MFKKFPLLMLPVRNGLMGAALGMTLLIGLYYMGAHPFLIPVYFDFRIILLSILMIFTLKEFRDFYRQRILSFWEGMIMSLLLTITFASLSFFVLWGFGAARPEFITRYVALTLDQIRTIPPEIRERIGEAELARNIKALPETRAVDLASLYFSQTFIISFFLSIIISLILRRQPQNPQIYGTSK